jgi:hypothetical protein
MIFGMKTAGNQLPDIDGGWEQAMEKEALILKARAELAKLAARYANDDDERVQYEGRGRAYEAQAREIEDALNGWRL